LISITPWGFIGLVQEIFLIIIAFEFTRINNETANLKKNEHRSIRRSSDPLRFFVFGK
jgi:hypothetical protein